MWSKSSSGCTTVSFEFIATNFTPFGANFSALARVISSEPSTYGQWLHVKKTTRIGVSEKVVREYCFPSVAGSEKSGAASPSSSVNAIEPPYSKVARNNRLRQMSGILLHKDSQFPDSR